MGKYRILVLPATLCLLLNSCSQETYEDCIIENMKTAKTDLIAAQIQMACKNKFEKTPTPKPGDKLDGYVFKGGNPNDQSNWKKE